MTPGSPPWPTRSAPCLPHWTGALAADPGGARRSRGGIRRGPRRTAASGIATPRSARPPMPCGWLAGSRHPRNRPRHWPRARPGCSAPGPGPTAPSPRSPAPTRAGCRALAHVYAALWEQARDRRAGLDADFAGKYAAWTEASSASDDLLLVENLLDRIARPVAEQRPPVIVILDGMTAAAGIELAGELTSRGGWLEGGRHEDGREPVLATVPSITAISRTSLLTGALKAGDQAQEKAGFAAFWGRRKSALFHKANLAPDPGDSLASQVRDAIASADTVVGVVLNAIDDALDKGKQGPAHWTPDQVTYLRPVLDEARRAGRPVILTADHGHVLDRGEGAVPAQPRNPPAIARVPQDQARSPCAARASSTGKKSSPRSTRRSTTPPDGPATTAVRPWPRSSYRSSSCCRPTACFRPAGTPTTPPGTPLPGGTPRRRAPRNRRPWSGRGLGQAGPAAPQARGGRCARRGRALRRHGGGTHATAAGPAFGSPSAARLSPRPGWRASGRRSPGPPPRPTSPR